MIYHGFAYCINPYNSKTRQFIYHEITGAVFLVENWRKEKNFQHTTADVTNAPSPHASLFTSFVATGMHKSSVSSSSYFQKTAVTALPHFTLSNTK